jgi:hypothetical protein
MVVAPTVICGPGASPQSAGGRAGLLGQLFGLAYPDATLRAWPKATFAEVFWRRHTRPCWRRGRRGDRPGGC